MSETIAKIMIDGSAADVFFPPASARGIQTSLTPIDSGDLRRTVNGTLVDLTREELRKYRLSLSADGQALPAAAGLWRGMRCTVTPPITWTAQVGAGDTSVAFQRPAASARMFDAVTLEELAEPSIAQDALSAAFSAANNPAWIEYQPTFEALLTFRSDAADEWEASATWALEFEEV